ncbi:hypothetical protein ACQKNX_22710 [Lysinibacillus sp. NPDC093712]|uniref:hypothetical protein n=1 Tax=Lysinibacillus sp. NPDC093712 TaxID=3390579 RepID=UPI003D04E89A
MVTSFTIPVNLNELDLTEDLLQAFERNQSKVFSVTTKLALVSDLLPKSDVSHLSPFTNVLVVADYDKGQIDIDILKD